MKHFCRIFVLLGLFISSGALFAQENASTVRVKLVTSAGDITLKLYPQKSPVTVKNFLAYVDSGFYNETIFHRVIRNFMVQGGGFTTAMTEKESGEPIVNESRNKLHNIRGTIAMARTSEPDSATAQFFINQRSNLQLDWAPGKEGYTVFGEVEKGMGVVDFIATADTDTGLMVTNAGQRPFQDVPVEAIVIKKVVRIPGK
ncbi:MAG: peptidyl-prolyl cis-trans isomerase [Halieaceae bacterium]|jgi:cyclophilin family peptidyl-prolyl cis-trans isomerase|nr:peptidyl-prolyl cis-trans isomerase [Halieaceae bacterium]MDG2137939.1 peptidylprolyl isomerase [Luminiphilus sp.]